MRVKCLAQEHNTMSLIRAQTRTACSRVERTNHEVTAPPHFFSVDLEKDVNIFGRGTSNDVCFEPRAFKKNPQYQAISTKHFKLYRVCTYRVCSLSDS